MSDQEKRQAEYLAYRKGGPRPAWLTGQLVDVDAGMMPEGDPDGPRWPWPRIPMGAFDAAKRFNAAPPEQREQLFAEIEAYLSLDLIEWDKFLRGTRAMVPDFKIPARYDDWKLGREMRLAEEAAESRSAR